MSRFILIDQSIVGKGGHYYEYALRVLTSAEQAGYTPTLVTNRRFEGSAEIPWPVQRIYRYAFFVGLSKPASARLLERFRDKWERLRFGIAAGMLFSTPGQLWLRRRQLLQDKTYWHRSGWILPLLALVLFKSVGFAIAALTALCGLLPGKSYLARIGGELRRLAATALRPLGYLFQPPQSLARMLAHRLQLQAFGADTQKLFRKIGVEPGDLVFIPTINDAEMLGLLEYFRRNREASRRPTWHLLFRRNIYQGRDPDYAAQDEGLRALRNTFRYLADNLDGQKVCFYTDTEELTAQYQRLGVFEFQTLPIPVSPEYLAQNRPPRDDAKVTVAYVGDARTEKGYQYLPRLVHDMRARGDQPQRVRFCFQSNFNTPCGEPKPAVARAQLQQLPPDLVDLRVEPLSSRDYREVVLDSDVLLIPYDPFNYYARSSGVFVEAMTAGVPVVVPGGTWMALQLEAVIADYRRKLRSTAEVLNPKQDARLRWTSCGGDRWSVNGQGSLVVNHRMATSTVLDVPRGSTHVMVSFRQVARSPGRFLCGTLEQSDRMGHAVRRESLIASACEWQNSMLFATNPQAHRARLYLEAAYSAVPLELGEVQIEFLQTANNCPLSSVGMVYADPDNLTLCVREIVEHLEHYRQSAARFARTWSRFHNPRVLVGRLSHRANAAVRGPAAVPTPTLASPKAA